MLLGCVLQKYSKKRQNDLASFAGLILIVVWVSHVCACIWLLIGKETECGESDLYNKCIAKYTDEEDIKTFCDDKDKLLDATCT